MPDVCYNCIFLSAGFLLAFYPQVTLKTFTVQKVGPNLKNVTIERLIPIMVIFDKYRFKINFLCDHV